MSKADIQRQFDYAVGKILKQGRPAGTQGVLGDCAYRKKTSTGEVLKCPVGWLIPDSYFKKNWKHVRGTPVSGLSETVYNYPRMAPFRAHRVILQNLQYAHDDASDCYSFRRKDFNYYFWLKAREIAAEHGLAWNFKPPKGIQLT